MLHKKYIFFNILSVFDFFCIMLGFFQADLSIDVEEGSGIFYGVSSQYSGTENITISVSTKVCSFGKQVVEKVEVRKKIFLTQSTLFVSDWRIHALTSYSDGICTPGGRKVHVSNPPFTHVWIYDQLHPQTEAPARKIHDEQCTREFHYSPGNLPVYFL